MIEDAKALVYEGFEFTAYSNGIIYTVAKLEKNGVFIVWGKTLFGENPARYIFATYLEIQRHILNKTWLQTKIQVRKRKINAI